MKALTIKQPWASLIMAGLKRVENRTWPVSFRGPLLIHAGQRSDPDGTAALERSGIDCQDLKTAPRGVILGVVDLIDVVRLEAAGRKLEHLAGIDMDPYGLLTDPWACGPWCWILRRPRQLSKPIPCRGQRGLWEYSDTLHLRRPRSTIGRVRSDPPTAEDGEDGED